MMAPEDPELFDWLLNASGHGLTPEGGSFIQTIAEAGLRADGANYQLLRPVLLVMKSKYQAYARPSGPLSTFDISKADTMTARELCETAMTLDAQSEYMQDRFGKMPERTAFWLLCGIVAGRVLKSNPDLSELLRKAANRWDAEGSKTILRSVWADPESGMR